MQKKDIEDKELTPKKRSRPPITTLRLAFGIEGDLAPTKNPRTYLVRTLCTNVLPVNKSFKITTKSANAVECHFIDQYRQQQQHLAAVVSQTSSRQRSPRHQSLETETSGSARRIQCKNGLHDITSYAHTQHPIPCPRPACSSNHSNHRGQHRQI